MTHDELRAHIELRSSTPAGTIARRTTEHLPDGKHGETVVDVRPAALAFIKATHGRECACRYCQAAA